MAQNPKATRQARKAFRQGKKADALDFSYAAMFQAEQVCSGGYYVSFSEPAQNEELSEQHAEAYRIRQNIKEWATWAFVAQ